MANESTKWLYEQLTSQGYNVGKDLQEFEGLMQSNEESRKWAYDTATKSGLNVGKDIDEFTSLVAPAPVQQQTTAAQPRTTTTQPEAEATSTDKPFSPSWQDKVRIQIAIDSGNKTIEAMNASVENVNRLMESRTPEGKKKMKLQEDIARSRGIQTKPIGILKPDSPSQSQNGGEGNTGDMVAPIEGARFHSMTWDKDGNYVPQWIMPDGSLTTSFVEADKSVTAARQERNRLANLSNTERILEDEKILRALNERYEERMKEIRQQILGKGGDEKDLKKAIDKDPWLESLSRQRKLINRGQTDKVNKEIGRNETQLKEINDRKSEDYDNYLKWNDEEGFWDNLARIIGGNARRSVENQHPVNKGYERSKAEDKDLQMLLSENHTLNEARKYLEARKLKKSEGFMGGFWAWGNNAKNMAKGAQHAASDVNLYSGGIMDLQKAAHLIELEDKIKRNDPLTDAESNFLYSTMLKQSIAEGTDIPHGYTAAEITVNMVPFMMQIATNPASGFSQALVRNFGKTGIKKLALTIAGDIAESTVLANTLQAAATSADAMQRYIGEVGKDSNGNFTFEGNHNWGEAIAKAEGAAVIENYTEMLGEHFGTIKGFAGKWMEKGARAAGGGKVVDGVKDLVTKVKSTDWAKGIADLESKAKWNGTVGEILEEEAGIVLNSIFTGDNEIGDLWDADQQIDIVLGVGLFSGFVSGIKTLGYPLQRRNIKKNLRNSDSVGSFRFGEEWEGMRAEIENADESDLTSVVNNLIKTHAKSSEQAKSIINYANALMKARGYNLAKATSEAEGELSPESADIEESFEHGYELGSGEDSDAMNEAKKLLDNRRGKVVASMSEDAIAVIDSDPIEYVSQITEPELRQTVLDYINAKMVYDGMLQRVRDDIDSEIAQADLLTDQRTNKDTGMVQPATMKMGDRPVYIVKGNVVMFDDGSGIDHVNSDQDIWIIDAETGKLDMTYPGAFLNIGESIDPEQEKEAAREAIRQEKAQEAANNINGVVQLEPGESYNILTPEGEQKNMAVLWNTKDENGMPIAGMFDVELPDGTITSMAEADIQAMIEEARAKRVEDFEAERNSNGGTEELIVEETGNNPVENIPEEGNNGGENISFTTKESEPESVRDEEDPLLGEVEAYLREEGYLEGERKATASILQRRFRIGFLRAKELIDRIYNEDGKNRGENLTEAPQEARQDVAGSVPENADLGTSNVPNVPESVPNNPQSVPTEGEIIASSTENVSEEYQRGYDDTKANVVSQMTDELLEEGITKLREDIDLLTEYGRGVLSAYEEEQQRRANETTPPTQDNIEVEETVSAMSQIPVDEETGKPKWHESEPETTWDALVEETGDEETAMFFAQNQLNRAEKEVKKAEKVKPLDTDDLNEFKNSEIARKSAIDNAKAIADHWRKVGQVKQNRQRAIEEAQREAARIAAEEARAKAEQERAEREEAERIERENLNGVPDWSQDTRADARARGYRRNGSGLVERQEPLEAVTGNEVNVKFSDKEIPTGKVAVIEAENLQPSHIQGQMNSGFFIDEAQPKKRTDAASVDASRKIASNIRPEEITSSVTAYTGAPTVNSRGEVIQGNNRSDALRLMWESYKEQGEKYRQYLIDQAEELGLDAEAIRNMKNPVLVNMLDVADEEAIRLGQYGQTDIESGGVERIKPKQTVQKMGKATKNFANILLRTSEEESSFSSLVDQNGVEALKWMSDRGYITPTQYKSAFDSKGNQTGEAANDLKGILYQTIFTGGSTQLEEMFNTLPAKAQRALLATAFRDHDSATDGKMLPEIQQSIMAFNMLMGYQPFMEAKNLEDAKRAAEEWKRSYAFDEVTGESILPSENFSNFAIELAARFKGHTQSHIQGLLNEMFDVIQGAKEDTLFEEADKTPKTLAEAIKIVLDMEYQPVKKNNDNGQNGSDNVAINGEDGETGGSRSSGGTEGREQSEEGTEPADSGRGTETDSREGISSEETPTSPTIGEKIAEAEAEVNTEPTDKQKEAGNYKMGHVKIGKFDMTIENPKGSVRSGIDADGKAWSVTMQHTYGYIKGTKGVDGDHIDVYASSDIDGWNGEKVFVIDQYNPDGTFDEHKVMLGFNDKEEAYNAYLSNYEKDWEKGRRIDITEVSTLEFEKWIDSSKRKTKPFAEYKSVKTEALEETPPQTDNTQPKEENPAEEPEKPESVTNEEVKIEEGYKTPKKKKEYVKVTLPRVEKAEWTARNAVAKRHGGFSFGGGYLFNTREEAEAFVEAVMNPQSIADEKPLSLADLQERTGTQTENQEKKERVPKKEKSGTRKKEPVPENTKPGTTITDKEIDDLEQRRFEEGSKPGLTLTEALAKIGSVNDYGKEIAVGETYEFEDGTPFKVMSIEGHNIMVESNGRRSYWPSAQLMERISEQKPQEPGPKNPSGNKLVTDEAYAELLKRMRQKLGGQLNMGIDPEILAIGAQMAIYHIEKGARKFADYVKAMIADLGEKFPAHYLKGFYNNARDLLEVEAPEMEQEMTPYDEVRRADVATIINGSVNAFSSAEMVVNERKAEKEKAEAEQKLKEERNQKEKSKYPDKNDKEAVSDWMYDNSEKIMAGFEGFVDSIMNDPEKLATFDSNKNSDEIQLETLKGYISKWIGRQGTKILNEHPETVKAWFDYKTNNDAIATEFKKEIQNRLVNNAFAENDRKNEKSETPKGTEGKRIDLMEDATQQALETLNKFDGKKNNNKKPVKSEANQGSLFNFEEETNTENNDLRRNDGPRTEGLPANNSRQSEGHRENSGEKSEGTGQTGERTDRRREGSEAERTGSLSSGLPRLSESERKNTRNNHAERGKDYAPKGEDARIKANIEAIELAQRLLESGETATPEQMEVLRKFSGWGGLGKAFSNEAYSNKLKQLLGDQYQEAVESRKSAFYTPAPIIDTLWDIAKALGFKGGKVLEGSAGIGNILGLMPRELSERSEIQAVEVDPTTGGILSLLYPDAQVDIKGFEETQVENGSVDLSITNVPFITGWNVIDTTGDKDLSKKFKDIHDFCIAKNIRKLREGGIGIFITSNATLDNSAKLRAWITNEGNSDVVGAFRLNNETFGGTGTTSDIIIVRKRINGRKSPHAIDISESSGERNAEFDTGETRKKKVDGTTQEIPVIKNLPMDYNRYFIEHPENMGGEMHFGFEKGDTYRPTSKGLYPVKGKSQEQLLKDWANRFNDMDFEAVPERIQEYEATYDKVGNEVKYGSLVVDDRGRLCFNSGGVARPLMSPRKNKQDNRTDDELISLFNNKKIKGRTRQECLKDYNAIKKALKDVLDYQKEHEDNEGLEPLLKNLNKAFDIFVQRYGNFHKNNQLSWLKNDVDYPSVLALETFEEKNDNKGNRVKVFGKTDIFKRRVVGKETEPQPKNIKDGILASMYISGRLDVGYIAEKLNMPEEKVKEEIVASGLGFENPVSREMEVSYEYLSGNVREKLRQAQENNSDGKYDANIKALEKIVPMNIPAHLIEFTLGSSWITPKLYEDYIREKTGVDVKLSNVGGTWFMKAPEYGVQTEQNRSQGVYSEMLRITVFGHQIIDAAITNRQITVSRTHKNYDGSSETITDREATAAVSAKVDEFRQDFKDWARSKMQSDPDMSEQMEKIYNERFNNSVPMNIPDEFVPEHFGGQVSEMGGRPFSMRTHQSKAAIRGTTQSILLAHEVGTGKTFTLITTAMEMRRLGTARKPMIIVQNATVGQFVDSAKELYPNAKILTLEDADRNAQGRKDFYAKIKYNDWDMIVIPQSVLDMIPDSEERQIRYIQDIIDEKMLVLEQMKEEDPEGKSWIAKQAQNEIDKKEAELAAITEALETKRKKTSEQEKRDAQNRHNAKVRAMEMLDRATDDVENFDDMGIDALLVDEAHEYKHLGFATAMQRGVKGVDPSYSKKAQGLYLKTQAIKERNNGKNVIFATGTPISNTAAEIWTFMRYLMPEDEMKEYGIYYFDDFVRNFGNLQQMLEFATNGKFKENNRFAGYVNLPELVRIWSTVADTVLTREAGEVANKIPEMEGGKAQDIYLPQTKALRSVMLYVKSQLDKYDKMSGKEKKANSHIPLTMYGIAKAAAVDARLVYSDATDDPKSKTNEAVRQTLKSLEDSKGYKGTVAIFADNYQNKESGFNLYEDIKKKLINEGVPEDQIVVMKPGMTVKKKVEIFDKVNAGDVRVILGSTYTLGTGVNIQERLHTLIHLDAPNRPMDYTQRNGRILRQGNLHKEMGIPVRVLRFGVEDSLDVTAYQRLKTKGAIADSIMNGKYLMENSMENRMMEEEEDVFGDITAQLSGSEYAMLKNQAEKEVRKLNSQLKQWESDQTYIHNQIPRLKGQIRKSQELQDEANNNLNTIEKFFPDGKFKEIKIGNQTFTDLEGMAKYFTDWNKVVGDVSDNIRDNKISGPQTRKLSVDIDGLKFEITTVIDKEMGNQGGTLFSKASRKVSYSCPQLEGVTDVPVSGARLKGAIEDIVTRVITGKQFSERAEAMQTSIERNQSELENLEKRKGKEFEHYKELEDAQNRLNEYTEKMKTELAAKEAKYAEMDSDVEALDEDYITLSEEDSEEANEREDNGDESGVRFRFAEEGLNREADFDSLRQQAINANGMVLPGLAEKEFDIVIVPRHDFKGAKKIDEAREWAKNNLVSEKGYTLTDSEGKNISYKISGKSLKEFLNEHIIKHSTTLDAHLSVLKELPKIISQSIEAEVHPDWQEKDEKGNRKIGGKAGENILVHRFYGAVNIDGKIYRVKTTIHETRRTGNKGYSFEAVKIELLDETPSNSMEPLIREQTPTEGTANIGNKSNKRKITGAELLKGVDKSHFPGVKLLDESSDLELFRIREGAAPRKTGKGYKVFVLKDGKLYPPMVANPNGEATPVGVWLDADAAPVAGTSKTGRQQVKAGGKGTQGGSGTLAYRPGWHLGTIPYALQFNRKGDSGEKELFPKNFVWAEVDYADDVNYQEEAMSYGINKNGKFQHSLAGLPRLPENGSYSYRTNPNPETDPWIITGAMKVNRLLTPSEVDAMVRKAGREPQKRQEGAITDEQINALNKSYFDERGREGEKVGYTDAEISEASDPWAKAWGGSLRSRKQQEKWAERERKRMKERAKSLGKRLGLNIEIRENSEGLEGKKARAKGWYDVKTGKITVIVGNHTSVGDMEKTILHEAVAHHGLRELLGEHFDEFLDKVYWAAELPIRQKIASMAIRNGWNLRVATEEYLAGLAEETEFGHEGARDHSPGWFEKIKKFFIEMLLKAGFKHFGKESISDNELRYVLWRSYQNLANPGRYGAFEWEAQDVAMKDKLGVLDQQGRKEESRETGWTGGEAAEAGELEILYRDGDFTRKDAVTVAKYYEGMVKSWHYQFREAVQDSMLGLKKLYEAVLQDPKLKVEEVAGFENAYIYENRMSSTNAAEQQQYFTQYMKPLLKAISDLCGRREDLRREMTDYMMAKHGLERNAYMRAEAAKAKEKTDRDFAGLTALTGEDDWAQAELLAQDMVDQYEADHDMALIDELWRTTKEATQETLTKLWLSGIISEKTLNNVSGMYAYYIPLRGWDQTTSDEVYGYLTSKDGPLRGNVMKSAEGRSSKADDPIATIAMMADDAIRQGNRNIMKQRFLNFAWNHPSDLVSVSELWLEHDDVTDEWVPVFADLTPDMTTEEVANELEKFEAKMEGLMATEPDKYKKGRDAINIPYKVVKGNLNEHQVIAKRNGRTYVMTINGNPRAAQALNGLTNPDVEQNGVVGNMLKLGEFVNRQLSAFYTTRNPDFVVSNYLRDMLYSNSMVWVKENPRYALKFHKNFGKVNFGTMRYLYSKWESGTLDKSKNLEKHFYDFMINGGETGYTNIKDIERHKKDIAKELKVQGSVGKKAWKILGMQLELLNRSVENNARFAAFLTSREMGRSLDRSIYDAKEISVNFNKKGSGGKMVNATGQTTLGKVGSYLSGGGRIAYVFWNAGVQGMTNFGRAFKRNPIKALTAAATMYVLGTLQPILAELMGGDGDDDDKNAYYNLPEYIRRSCLCLWAGNQWITIPISIEQRAIFGMGELTYGVISGNERYSDGEMGLQIASQFSQLLPLDMLEGGGGLSPLIPSAVKPLVEAYVMNKGWTGMPIYKDNGFNKLDPEWTKAYASADQNLVDFARWLNETTGGDDYKKGKIDINPAKLEYLLSGTFGGMVSFPTKIKKTGETIFSDREFDWRNIPLANRVVKSGDERTANRKLLNEYYKYYNENEETGRLLRKYENAAEEGIFEYAEKINFLWNSKENLRHEIFEEYNKELKEIGEAMKGEVNPEVRKELEGLYFSLMREMVNELHKTEKKAS